MSNPLDEIGRFAKEAMFGSTAHDDVDIAEARFESERGEVVSFDERHGSSPTDPGNFYSYYEARYSPDVESSESEVVARNPSSEQAVEDVGNFMRDLGKAERFNKDRSPEARASDKGKEATVTTNFERWKNNPDDWDFPTVDTPDR